MNFLLFYELYSTLVFVFTLFLMASGVWVVVLTFVVFILTILPVLNGKFMCLVFSLWVENEWGSAGLCGNLQRFPCMLWS